MDRGLAVGLTAFAGGLIAMQAPINGRLGSATGGVQAALFSFLVGGAALAVFALVFAGGFSGLGEVRSVPTTYLLGGFCGAIYVVTALTAVKTLGAGGVTVATIAGQLTLSILIDQFGWFGVEKNPISATRLLGVLVLALGVWLVVRD
ncbi:MAG TPA: DMT family transporter [Baekduia sp.]|nr:DMT family transporter [Baekduia sp.]